MDHLKLLHSSNSYSSCPQSFLYRHIYANTFFTPTVTNQKIDANGSQSPTTLLHPQSPIPTHPLLLLHPSSTSTPPPPHHLHQIPKESSPPPKITSKSTFHPSPVQCGVLDLGDLLTPEEVKEEPFAKRVFDFREADVIFVPFFATLSAEFQLGISKGVFRKRADENEDYKRQKMVVDLVKKSEAWQKSGGRDHVFVLTDPVAMWHVKDEIGPAILLVVDFGGWYNLDFKASNNSSSGSRIHHTQVSLLKDVIVPYTHLLPRLHISENLKRQTLLYFKGAKHRHRGGLVREKLWDLLINEPGVIFEEGFPNATGKEQSIKGMRTSEFCLHPAGDTPMSCRLFDAIQSLCIPVIVSDNIELPFEGMVDYSEFSVFVAVSDALRPNWLVSHLRSYSSEQKDMFRKNMAQVQPFFQYDNGHPGGIGPTPVDGAVNNIWKKVHQKLPMIKEAITRQRRKPPGISVPVRCHCT
ncbi:hypothetical protein Pfo_017297 [Paulownia fortunei]|nr:hypothetical protein Pfo_017297 [Paulownia fortunei]